MPVIYTNAAERAALQMKINVGRTSEISNIEEERHALHEDVEIKCFYKGSTTLLVGTQTITASAGDVVVINPYEFHATIAHSAEPSNYHLFMIPLDYLTDGGLKEFDLRRLLLTEHHQFCTLFRQDKLLWQLLMDLADAFAQKSTAYPVAVRGLMTQVFGRLLSAGLQKQDAPTLKGDKLRIYQRVEPALRHIRDHYKENITVDKLAELCSTSKYHFCRVFKQITGYSAMEYLREYRLKVATAMLTHTHSTIGEIARLCGFEDANYFSRCYKARYGISPNQKRGPAPAQAHLTPYTNLLHQKELRIVITGDSLSYNRYGYDPRGWGDAFECGAGMPSWSFKLQEQLLLQDPQFVLAKNLQFNCPCHLGINATAPARHIGMFDNNVMTLTPDINVEFFVNLQSDQLVLYLQKRTDAPCLFDVAVDDVVVQRDVDTTGTPKDFSGYGPKVLKLPCRTDLTRHKVTLFNLRGIHPKITMVGVGALCKSIALTGRGSTCADYFLEHFDDRIGQFTPDLLLLSLTANDRVYSTLVETKSRLEALFDRVFTCNPNCKLLFILPPESYDPQDPQNEESPYFPIEKGRAFNREIAAFCLAYAQKAKADVSVFSIADLFLGQHPKEWRFDNIHLNPKGNTVVLQALAQFLGLTIQ